MGRVLTYIRDFGAVTTLHGIAHIVATNRHSSEIYLWLVVTVLATIWAVTLIAQSWQRYYANPTVLSLEKNFQEWKVPFPAATICLINRVNQTTAAKLIQKEWKVKRGDKKFDYYMRFVQSVANLTYDNLGDFHEFKDDKELYSINMSTLASKVQVNLTYSANIFDPKFKQMKFEEVITEMGICYTYSGLLPFYISLWKDVKRKYTIFGNLFPKCNFLNSLCYARIEDLPGVARYYIHSPYELPDLSTNFYMVKQSRERDTSFRFIETRGSREALKRLTPRQRKCRFLDEPKPDMSSVVYSYNLCRMNCRKRLAYKKCGCAPYFYMEEKDIPVCNVRGLACLNDYKELITTLIYEGGTRYPCECSMPCSSIEYYVDNNIEKEWTYPVADNIRFRWAIEVYSKTKIRRDIIFGFEDLLVSFGGTAAFFLGCSVITFVELIYFFTLRLYWFLHPRKKSPVNNVRPKIKVARFKE